MEAACSWVRLPFLVCFPADCLFFRLQELAVLDPELNVPEVWDVGNCIHQIRHLGAS